MGRRKNNIEKKRGLNYRLRVANVNRIYEKYSEQGLSNREIWRRHIYPLYGICERTFYNLLKASSDPEDALAVVSAPSLFDDLDYDQK